MRELRELRALTQERLAELAGIAPQHLGLVERGEANATIDLLAAVATELSVEVAHLVQPALVETDHPIGPTDSEWALIDQALRIVDRYRRGR
ncbi:MAG: helix-turn-helix transcriptional regulator [Acidobacteria bacterium]|nr:helix-turn-helix transcriptional regulator [Acidobacteriota bacterium]